MTKGIEVYTANVRTVKAQQYFMKNNKWTLLSNIYFMS